MTIEKDTQKNALELQSAKFGKIIVWLAIIWAFGVIMTILSLSFGFTPKQQTKLALIAWNLCIFAVFFFLALRKIKADDALRELTEKETRE